MHKQYVHVPGHYVCEHPFVFLLAFLQITDSIAFINFTHERSIPYRKCDFFDEVLVQLIHCTLNLHACGLPLQGV